MFFVAAMSFGEVSHYGGGMVCLNTWALMMNKHKEVSLLLEIFQSHWRSTEFVKK